MRVFSNRYKRTGRSQLIAGTVIGLVVGVGVWGGPAIANHLTVRSGDIVNGQVKAADLGKGSIATGKLRKGSVTSAKIRDGNVRHSDLAGGAVAAKAYAHVAFDGTVDASKSRRVANSNVTRESVGTFCFSGLPFTPRHAMVTKGIYGPNYAHSIGVIVGESPYCSGTADQITVIPFDDSGSAVAFNFAITIY